MLDPKTFLATLKSAGITFTTGVPDSLLKNFCACISDEGSDIIAANEGASVALGIGHHLATGGIPLVYMQNSGFGNTMNPLLSLADKEVYAIPMLLMIGWRGEPDVKDEPQHIKQGRVSESLLKSMEIPYVILSEDQQEAEKQVVVAFDAMKRDSCPYALLVKKGTFDKYSQNMDDAPSDYLNREHAIEMILNKLDENDVVVSTTGKSSREVFEIREKNGEGHSKDFLTVGGMGHASQIALGIALSRPDRKVYCLDGDGAMIMHLGSAAIIGTQNVPNYRHIVVNNGCHESVGGQPSVGFEIDFRKIAEACGYKVTHLAENESQLNDLWAAFAEADGPTMLEVRTTKESRDDLGRPTTTPRQNKEDYMQNLL
ncbi:MAG: phosphonopyruvate decarboxylase [Cyclobacteriaceae bacterium]